MDPELLRRVRWGNLARAAALLAIVAAVIAWPRLGPPEPGVPPGGVEVTPGAGAPQVEERRETDSAGPGSLAARRGDDARSGAGRHGAARSAAGRHRGRGGAARSGAGRSGAGRHGGRGGARRRGTPAPPEPLDVPEVAPAPVSYPEPLPEFGAE